MNQQEFPSIFSTRDATSIVWEAEPPYPFSRDDIFNVRSSKLSRIDHKHVLTNKLFIELGLTARAFKDENCGVLCLDQEKNIATSVHTVGGMLKCWMSLIGDDGKNSDYSYECKFKAIEKEFKRLEKNFKARKDRGGESSFNALDTFLTSEFQWSPRCVCVKKSKSHNSVESSGESTGTNISTNRSSEACVELENESTNSDKSVSVSGNVGKRIGALVRENRNHKLKNLKLQTELNKLTSAVGRRTRDIMNEIDDMKESANQEISNLELKLKSTKEKLKNTVPLEKLHAAEKKLDDERNENKKLKKELCRSTVMIEGAEDKITELTLKLN